jgi:hypothetical protein
MYRDNMLAIMQTAVTRLQADDVTPSSAPNGYDAEAEGLLALLRDTSVEDLRTKAKT